MLDPTSLSQRLHEGHDLLLQLAEHTWCGGVSVLDMYMYRHSLVETRSMYRMMKK